MATTETIDLNNLEDYVYDIQLEESDVATEYAPYITAEKNTDNLLPTLEKISDNISNAYDELEKKGVVIKEKNNLPSEYQELEYIESTGTQYINTNFKPNPATTKVETEFILTNNTTSNQATFGSRYAINENQTSCVIWYNIGNTKKLRLDYTGNSDLTAYVELNQNIKVIALNNTVNVNGIDYKSNVIKEDTYLQNDFLIGNHNTGNVIETEGVSAKWKKFKIYDNGTLIRDYVPCYRKLDNEIGMYDLVNNVFYTNSGTGAFIKGPNVNIEKNTYNLSKAIKKIESKWQPQEDWWDIDKILEEDTEDYPAKMITLISDIYDTQKFTITNSGQTDKINNLVKVKTSDGAEYTETTTHTWDKTKDKITKQGDRIRYVIYYFNKNDITFTNLNPISDRRNNIYIIFKNMNVTTKGLVNNNYNFLASNTRLEYIKCINSNISVYDFGLTEIKHLVKAENVTYYGIAGAFRNIKGFDNLNDFNFNLKDITNCAMAFLSNYRFKYIPYIDTSKVTNFSQMFNGYTFDGNRVEIIENLDFSSATNVQNMFGYCFYLKQINNISNIKINGLKFNEATNLNNETLLRILNALYDYSSEGGTHTITLGATNLAKLTSEELAIGQNKGWTIN